MELPWGNSRQTERGPLGVLTVCEGNICRSPLAEQLLRARFYELNIAANVASAGLGALVGAPMDTIPAEISRLNGGDPDSHRARQLRSTIAYDADLILTMTRVQRDTVIQRHPRAMRSTFSLIEFARLLVVVDTSGAAIREGGLPALVGALAGARGSVRMAADDDVVDPYRRDRAIHESVGEQIAVNCLAIASSLENHGHSSRAP